jgi:nucleoside-diphosphate-sugar epimerase
VLHAGTGRAHSVREFVAHIRAVCGRPELQPLYGTQELRPGEPECYLASIERTTALTGWRPRLDVQAGLRRSWLWFRAQPPGVEHSPLAGTTSSCEGPVGESLRDSLLPWRVTE